MRISIEQKDIDNFLNNKEVKLTKFEESYSVEAFKCDFTIIDFYNILEEENFFYVSPINRNILRPLYTRSVSVKSIKNKELKEALTEFSNIDDSVNFLYEVSKEFSDKETNLFELKKRAIDILNSSKEICYENENEVSFETSLNKIGYEEIYPISVKNLENEKNKLKKLYGEDWKYHLIPISKIKEWMKFYPMQKCFNNIYFKDYEDLLDENEKEIIKKYKIELYDIENGFFAYP